MDIMLEAKAGTPADPVHMHSLQRLAACAAYAEKTANVPLSHICNVAWVCCCAAGFLPSNRQVPFMQMLSCPWLPAWLHHEAAPHPHCLLVAGGSAPLIL